MYSLKRNRPDSGVNPFPTGFVLAVIVLVLGACDDPNSVGLTVDSAWVRSMPPGSKTTAAYFTLNNNTTETIRVIEARSVDFSSASLHNTVVKNGVVSMEEIPVLVLEPGESVSLEPGGKHLMLTGKQFADNPAGCCVLRLEIEGRDPLLFHAPINR